MAVVAVCKHCIALYWASISLPLVHTLTLHVYLFASMCITMIVGGALVAGWDSLVDSAAEASGEAYVFVIANNLTTALFLTLVRAAVLSHACLLPWLTHPPMMHATPTQTKKFTNANPVRWHSSSLSLAIPCPSPSHTNLFHCCVQDVKSFGLVMYQALGALPVVFVLAVVTGDFSTAYNFKGWSSGVRLLCYLYSCVLELL